VTELMVSRSDECPSSLVRKMNVMNRHYSALVDKFVVIKMYYRESLLNIQIPSCRIIIII